MRYLAISTGEPKSDADSHSAVPRVSTRRDAERLLGQGFSRVVLDFREGLDPDALGAAHGLVVEGGTLELWLPNRAPVHGPEHLAAHPFEATDVTRRFAARAETILRGAATASPPPPPAAPQFHGTTKQHKLVGELSQRWRQEGASKSVLTADRGRGKSSALGLALSRLPDQVAVVVTGPSQDAVAEVLRFAGPRASYVAPAQVLEHSAQVVVVDEAASVPLPMLRAVAAAHAGAHLVFATTVHGYEGTGRGFSLRFVPWLEARGAVTFHSLSDPIRYSAGDRVEAAVFDALLLDAAPLPPPEDLSGLRCLALDRDELAADDSRLRQVFGLLVQAHHRTRPSDLERMLDAPNITVHAAMVGETVVGATWVAREGELPPQLCERAYRGEVRLRAHALADALVSHLGHPEAGGWPMARSVRIAVSQEARRRGVARALVEHVHEHHRAPELFGTWFGASADLIAFRRAVGYELAGLSASIGARSGEPSVLMIRPRSDRARDLLDRLRRELAAEIDLRIELLHVDAGLPLERELVDSLRRGLPAARAYTPQEALAAAQTYAAGPRTFESMATAIRQHVIGLDLSALDLEPAEHALLTARVVDTASWGEAARRAGLPGVGAAMKALRRAVRATCKCR